MINTADFINRLQKIIDFHSLSASSFADKVGVQRSSISHILSGRNKPSLEFVMKVLTSFPEVDLYWLLNGKGHFPSQKNATPLKDDGFISQKELKNNLNQDIERIVIFYKDGSFKNYEI